MRQPSTPRKATSARQISPVIPIMAIALVFIGGYYLGNSLGWWTPAPVEPAVVPTYDYYSFNATELFSGTEIEDFNATEYTVDISEMTAEEIADLTYADFTAETIEAIDAEDTFDIDADLIQVFEITATGYSSKWVFPVPGENLVYLANQSADINIIAYETDGGGSTFASTTDDEWTITVIPTTTDVDYPEGWDSYNYDFENSDVDNLLYDCVVIGVEVNDTSASSYVSCADAYDEVVDGNVTYFYFATDISNAAPLTVDIVLSSGLGDTFEGVELNVFYGNLDTTLTEYDVQT